MTKQVLCIEKSNPPPGIPKQFIPKVGEIYTPLSTSSIGVGFRGKIDLWYTLQNMGLLYHHVSLFIDLPQEEGQVFKKEELKLEEIES